jgi:hypothetical protein
MVLKPPQSLVQHLHEGRCVLFAGSGLSAWAGFPTWTALLSSLIDEMRNEQIALEDIDEMARLLEKDKLLEVAEHCKTQLGSRYEKVLSERLRQTDTANLPEPHRIIVRLPFSGVVTTNYDDLLETGYQTLTSVSVKAPTHEDVDVLGTLLFDGSFFVLKAHGDLDRPATLVLTSSDYRETLYTNAAFTSFFSSILMSRAVLFLGYSLNDPDFRMLLDRHLSTFQRWVPDRYALMPGVGPVEAKVMWESMRIRVLPYEAEDGRHDAVLDFLRELERLVNLEAETGSMLPARDDLRMRPSGKAATTLPTPRKGSYASLSLELEGVELVSRLEDPAGSVHAGRGAIPDPIALSQLLPNPLNPQGTTAPVARLLSDSVAPNVLEQLPKIVPSREPVLLSVARELEALPWEWVEVDGIHLVSRNPVVRVPASLSQAARGYPVIGQPPKLLLLGDPTTPEAPRLPGALEEVEQIEAEAVAAGCSLQVLTRDQATLANVIAALRHGDIDVLHFAGHAWFDASEHYLALSDGQLRAAELRSLISARPPGLVFLNSHYTAFVPPFAKVREQSHGPEEMSAAGQLRFMDVAVAAGSGTFIGCLGSPTDLGARDVALNLYRNLFGGQPVARAFHEALVVLPSAHESDALKYVVSGSADVVLVERERD